MTVEPSELVVLAPGSHVCWVVGEPASYLDHAASVLAQAAKTNEKPVAFGPDGGDAIEALRPHAAIVADPRVAFLGGGPLDPDAMFVMFEEQSARAHNEGYRGLRLVADMDWLLPTQATTEAIVAFELLLDRHARWLGATIVCAYREASFDTEALAGARCVHPMGVGYGPPPRFRLVAGSSGTWRLVGDVDFGVVTNFETAITAAAGTRPCVLDASELQFIDVAGMRAIARAAEPPEVTIRVVGAPPILRRGWEMAGFAKVAPSVELVS